jgi:hypothetical protein
VSQSPDRDRWLRVRELVELVLAAPTGDRDRIIDEHCGSDAALAAEVRRLVAAHERGAALESPPDAMTAFADETAHHPGDRVGHYKIEFELARGGMGVVYRAWDTRLERYVALKALSPLLPAGAEARERLRLEARLAAKVSHESVAAIYAFEEFGTELFIVSEYVAGETLRARMASGPVPLSAAVSIALDVARGLAAAHELGVVHRDLKPENVMFAAKGRAKVVDFGIASIGGVGSGLTATGGIIGTPGYMAPEQVSGQGADARSDVFAVGVLLYEMLSGRPPFSASTFTSVVVDEPPAIESVRPDVPPTLALVVSTALAKTPGARYPTAGALVPALESVRDQLGSPTPWRPAPVVPTIHERPAAVWWFQFHQLAVTLTLALMMIPAWKLMSRLPRPTGRILVMTLLVIAAVLGTARLHLWFTARHHDRDLDRELTRVGPLLRLGNFAFALGLGAGGLAVADSSLELAAVCAAMAVITLVVGEVIEPATTDRARRELQPRP